MRSILTRTRSSEKVEIRLTRTTRNILGGSNGPFGIPFLASNLVIETKHTVFDETSLPKKETETQISIHNDDQDLTEAKPMTTTGMM